METEQEQLEELLVDAIKHWQPIFKLSNDEVVKALESIKSDFSFDDFHDIDCEQCALYGTDCESDPSGSCFVAKS